MNVDLDLVRKYNVAGPRYTSYPPATKFGPLGAEVAKREIAAHNHPERDVSLYFHLPFCRSLCWYCGCTTVITTRQKESGVYLNYLSREMGQISPLVHPDREVAQLHWGGGTPTFLLPDEIRRLGSIITEHFNLSKNIEAGVEIDPRTLTRDHVVALREIGFNRASLGVQDFDPQVQLAVHRIQPRKMVEEVVGWIRGEGFQSLNFDLIYGLPYQTRDSFARTLEAALEMNPDRFAVFNYAHVPWIKPGQKIMKEETLPAADVKLEILKLTIETLTSHGYVYIGMDHFAKADDELAIAQREKTLQRNFQGYSTHGDADLFAFGMSSISNVDGLYWQNEKELAKYYDGLGKGVSPITRGYLLNDDDKVRRHTIMRLMCDLGLDFARMSADLGLNFEEYFETELAALDDLAEDGLLFKKRGGLSVTETGRLFLRNIAMRFDATQLASGAHRYSKTI